VNDPSLNRLFAGHGACARFRTSPPLAASTLAASMIEPPPSATITSGAGLRFCRIVSQTTTRSAKVRIGDDVVDGDDGFARPPRNLRGFLLESRHVVGDERPAAPANVVRSLGRRACAELNPNRIEKDHI
jgi:hypothetical protein